MKIEKEDIGAGLIILLIGVPIGGMILLFKLDKLGVINIGSIEKFITNLFRWIQYKRTSFIGSGYE